MTAAGYNPSKRGHRTLDVQVYHHTTSRQSTNRCLIKEARLIHNT